MGPANVRGEIGITLIVHNPQVNWLSDMAVLMGGKCHPHCRHFESFLFRPDIGWASAYTHMPFLFLCWELGPQSSWELALETATAAGAQGALHWLCLLCRRLWQQLMVQGRLFGEWLTLHSHMCPVSPSPPTHSVQSCPLVHAARDPY